MFQSLKKLLFVCSLILSSCVVPIYAESENPLVYDQTQGKFQDFLNKQSGDVKVVMEKRFTETISIPDTITSLEIDLAGHSISGTMYANGIPLTIINGHTGRIYGGSYNADEMCIRDRGGTGKQGREKLRGFAEAECAQRQSAA